MRRSIIFYILATGSLSAPAMAQSSNYYSFDGLRYPSNQMSINAGMKFTLPLGVSKKPRSKKTRLGLNISLNHRAPKRWTPGTFQSSVDLLEFGVFKNGNPNLALLGQNIIEPKFDPQYANTDNEDSQKQAGKESGSNTKLYIAGGAALLALSAVLISEASDVSLTCSINESNNEVTC